MALCISRTELHCGGGNHHITPKEGKLVYYCSTKQIDTNLKATLNVSVAIQPHRRLDDLKKANEYYNKAAKESIY